MFVFKDLDNYNMELGEYDMQNRIVDVRVTVREEDISTW
jgi:hypothetical protein